MKGISSQLRSLREAAGLSQAEVARLIGIDAGSVSRWESPQYRGHRLTTLGKYAMVLGYEVEVNFVRVQEEAVGENVGSRQAGQPTHAGKQAKRKVK